MIRLFSILTLQLFFVSLIFSQWNRIYTSPGSYPNFGVVFFTSENTGYVTRGDSSVIKTTNGGISWFSLNGTSNYGLSGIQFTSQNTGFTVGNNFAPDRGYLLRTTNAGQNWSGQTFNYYFSSLKFVNNNTGYIITIGDTVDSVILKTTNSGLNWISKQVNAGVLTSIDFVNSDIGFVAAANGKFFKTSNGGINWLLYYTPPLIAIDFINEDLGFALKLDASLGIIYKTIDGGINWMTVYSKDSIFLSCPFFIDSNTGWICGGKKNSNNYNRLILKTTNSGMTWFEQSTGAQSDSTSCISTIFMLNSNTGYAVTYICLSPPINPLNPSVFKTINGGGDPIGILNNNSEISGYVLYQNYPNPFNPVTSIGFSIPVSGNVEIKIYNTLSEEFPALMNEYKIAGSYNINFDASNLPSGCYFYKMISGEFSVTKKMLFIK